MKTEIKKHYFLNGKLDAEYSYINGLQHGIQKDCFGNGLFEIWNCSYNEIKGISKLFHNDGTILKIKNYKKNILNGPTIEFNYEN